MNAEADSAFGLNSDAIAEVESGERANANAAWWGFNLEDVTESLQRAIDSGAETLRIPYMGAPWIVRPIQLRGDLELILDPGVVILAKEGEFHGRGDSLLTARGVENLVIRGYGAALRMRKRDYQSESYEKAEWRMGLSLRGCKNVLVEGLRIESSGGDGIYIDGGGDRRQCEDITVRDLTCWDNHRQGMSVISVDGLLVENCRFANTWGTPPGAGIDLEPDGSDQSLVDIVVRNSVFENNEGHEVLVYAKNLDETSPDLSIRFENCLMRKTMADGEPVGVEDGIGRDDAIHGWSGIAVATIGDDGPGGYVEFINCTVENTGKESVRLFDKSPEGAEVRFRECHFRNPWRTVHSEHWGVRVPIHLEIRRPSIAEGIGGVVFDDCHVYDKIARPVIMLDSHNREYGVRNISGFLTVHGPGEARMDLGPNARHVSLELREWDDEETVRATEGGEE